MTFNKYPYTNFHEMNLDWILNELKTLVEEWNEFESTYEGVTAQAETVPYGDGASVIVTGGEGIPFNFDFKIPAGQNLKVLSTRVSYGVTETSNVQPSEWYDTIPVIPQAYFLWTRVILNFSDGTTSTFYSVSRNGLDGTGSVVSVNNISPDSNGNVTIEIPQASDTTPQADTEYGYEGISDDYSRADHRHVADTNKVDKLSNETIGEESAYIIKDLTTQTKKGISSSPVPDNLVKYNSNGNLSVGAPLTANEVMRLVDVTDNFVSNTDILDYVKNTDYANSIKAGVIKPDNVSTMVDSNGILTAVSKFNTVLLWENSAPSSNFNAQTINVNYSNYRFIILEVASAIGTSEPVRSYLINTVIDKIQMDSVYNNINRRRATFNNNTITFEDGHRISTYGQDDATAYNQFLIPLRIYGII